MKTLSRITGVGLLFMAFTFCLSVSLVEARQLGYFWKGIRPLGMGGAFTAIADDYSALYYNPAGLDRIPSWSLAVINPFGEVGENGQELYNDFKDTDFDDTTQVVDLLRDHVGERQHLRAGLFPYFVRNHFGFGVLGQVNIDTEINNFQYPEVETLAMADVAGVGGIGFGFLKDHALRLGLSAKYVQRQRLEETYTSVQIASDNFDQIIEDDLMDGTGFGFDLGAMYTFPVFLNPTVALVIQNLGGVDLGDAGEIPQQINLGAALEHEIGICSLRAAMDIMDIGKGLNEDEDGDLFRRLHLGVESWLWQRLALRAGLYQGYGSIGLGLNFWLLKLDYANYAEELGAYAGQRADRRHLLQLSLGW